MKRPYNDAYLLAFSQEHLWYEVWMFYEMVDALTRQTAPGYVASTTSPTVVAVVAPPGMPNSIAPPPGASTGLTVVMANTCVEGFMVHLRNLIDFMWPTQIHDTDVVAADFCVAGAWKRPINQALSNARTRVHKELAHLTSDRISGSPRRKQWPYVRISAAVGDALRDFAATASLSRLSPRVTTAIR
jgi:hypothetical protein